MHLTKVLCMYVMPMYLGILVGLHILEMGAVSDSFACFWNPFTPTRLPHPALI